MKYRARYKDKEACKGLTGEKSAISFIKCLQSFLFTEKTVPLQTFNYNL